MLSAESTVWRQLAIQGGHNYEPYTSHNYEP